jgi:hypothetical protein
VETKADSTTLEDSSASALDLLGRFVLDGHVLKVSFGPRGQEMEMKKSAKAGEEKGKERKKTKMVVKNLLADHQWGRCRWPRNVAKNLEDSRRTLCLTICELFVDV